MDTILFLIFAAIAVTCAVNLVVQTHPISSAISLVGVMGSLAVLYLLLGGEFIAAVQLIVYAGAIMVLFIFVIMLLNAGKEDRTRGSRAAYAVGFPGAAAIFCLLSFVFLSERGALGASNIGGDLGNAVDNIAQVSAMLFTRQLLPFEVTSVLILVAIVGAVVLARKEQ